MPHTLFNSCGGAITNGGAMEQLQMAEQILWMMEQWSNEVGAMTADNINVVSPNVETGVQRKQQTL